MKVLRILLFPFAIIYGAITATRNAFYRLKIFRSSKFSIPVINIGNLSMGGTGKTPHTEYLIRLLKDDNNLFTLSRGFGRQVRGFQIASESSDYLQVGDEPLQYYTKFGEEIGVAVDANRVTGVIDICTAHPDTNLILLDDAYQHRAIQAGLNILLTAYGSPYYNDFIVPVGNLREARSGAERADIIIVTKCPSLPPPDKEKMIQKINSTKDQTVFFSVVKYGALHALSGVGADQTETNQKIILVTGIAYAEPLKKHLDQDNEVLHHFNFNDHHRFKEREVTEIHNLFDKFADENPIIVTTEKDAMRLKQGALGEMIQSYPWFFQSIEVALDRPEIFNKIITTYVEENR